MEEIERDPLDAWARARDSLLRASDLTEEEQEWLRSTTAEMVVTEVERLDAQHADKSWSRTMMSAIKPLLHGLNRFGPAMDVFAQADPQGILVLVWGSLRMILMIANKFNKYFEDLASFLDRISAPLGRLQEYEKLSPDSPRLGKALYAVFARFLDFTLKTRRMFLDKANRTNVLDKLGRKFFKKDPWKKYTSEVENDISEVRQLCEDAREEADLTVAQNSARSQKKAEEFYKMSEDFYKRQSEAAEENEAQRDNEKFRKIVSWLDPVDMRTVLEALGKERFRATCEWILENRTFGDWISSRPSGDHPPILWIHARPGAGKTFLAAHCAELLLEIGTVAYFFCDTKVQKRRTAISVCRTWVHQLLYDNPQLAREVEEVFYKSTVPTIVDMKKVLGKLLDKTDHCWFVLDGLDECEPEARADLLDICEHVMDRAKVLIISRKENDIDRRLSQLGEEKVATIVIEPEDNCKDIKSYVEAKVQDMEIDDEELEETVITRLVHGANGMFLWVRLIIEELEEAERDDDLEEALYNLPDGLDELYARVLDRINRFKKDSKRETARQLLQWIACAMEPLTVSEIEHALAITPDEESFNVRRKIRRTQDFIMETCGPLVEISQADQRVRMAHASVKDFLLSKKEASKLENPKRQLARVLDYLVDETDAHTRVASCCLTYISYAASRYVDVDADRKQSHARLEERLKTDVVLNYATIHWWRHILSIPELGDGIAKTLGSFLTSEEIAVYWLQMFHKLRGDTNGIGHPGSNTSIHLIGPLLQVRRKWIKVSGDRVKTWIDNIKEKPEGWSFRFYCFLTSGWFSYFLPIQIAAFFDYTTVIRKELSAGVYVDACNDHNETALLCASRGDSVASLRILLEAGANVNWIGDQTETAFHRSVSQFGLTAPTQLQAITHECAGLLLDAGINVSQSNFAGDRFIHYLCRRVSEDDAGVALLENVLNHGGTRDMESRNRDGVTPLHLTAYNNLPRMTEVLLEKGANPNGGLQPNQRVALTPLQQACKTRDPRIARILIDAGADPNIADPGDHRTPLHAACQFAPESVDLLLKAKADPTLKDLSGSTSLHHAARENRIRIISQLISHGGDVNAKDRDGRTPLDVAIEDNALGAIDLLTNLGGSSRLTKTISKRPTIEPESLAHRFPKTERDTMSVYNTLRTRLALPHGRLVRILNAAEYWVCSAATRRASPTNPKVSMILQQKDVGPAFVASLPVAGLRVRPVVKLVFRTRSHDQGFSDWPHLHGTYENSWTGFRARVLRDGKSGPEEDALVNRHAERVPRVHTVEWTRGARGDAFVRALQNGDVVEVVPYAMYPGWQNYVYAASVEVYTACFMLGETRGF